MSIIFLFTGNARTFPFNIYYNMRNAEILDSYNKYIFTDKFKSLYKYIFQQMIYIYQTR